ncbi:hypothetical protein L1987_53222 [Smallanthus sonchifolius]|uniref:Uncharacterized protein n=1 Tax=Smallanthus sonchifolius TaxID=185202 RepID=A0ACB9EVN9_9ASTR|nr:hypothetical protein L1987_53222 [Smallanthus sonchifolius]
MAGVLYKKSLPLSRFVCLSPIKHIRGGMNCVVFKGVPCSMRTEEEVKAMFSEWAMEHGKSYNSLSEKNKRFENFRNFLRSVDLHNSTGDPSSQAGLQYFSDLTFEEIKARCCGGIVNRSHPGGISRFKSSRLATAGGCVTECHP